MDSLRENTGNKQFWFSQTKPLPPHAYDNMPSFLLMFCFKPDVEWSLHQNICNTRTAFPAFFAFMPSKILYTSGSVSNRWGVYLNRITSFWSKVKVLPLTKTVEGWMHQDPIILCISLLFCRRWAADNSYSFLLRNIHYLTLTTYLSFLGAFPMSGMISTLSWSILNLVRRLAMLFCKRREHAPLTLGGDL